MPRTFDSDGYRCRACMVLLSPDGSSLLLVSSSKRPAALVLPGGGVEPLEPPPLCAARELWEEAGAVLPPSARAPLLHGAPVAAKNARTLAFLAVATGAPLAAAYPEAGLRTRAWVPLRDAAAALSSSAVGAAVWGAAVEELGVGGALGDAAACLAAARGLLAAAHDIM